MVEAGFVIARGATQPLDIATCEGPGSSPQVPQTFYSFLSLSWAIVADIDIESETYRCCGKMPQYRCRLGCILLKMAAILSLTGLPQGA